MQTKLVSAIEAATNTGIGYLISVGTGQIVYPLFGYPITLRDNFVLTAIFVTASYIRAFGFRRLFEHYLNGVLTQWTQQLKTWCKHLSNKWLN